MVPKISVVIVTWNRCDALQEALNSVLAQDFDGYEIVVVDNNSTDGTEHLVRECFPTARYFRVPYNAGVPGGRNFGIANALSELILFLDDDAIILDTKALSKIHKRFSEEPELAVVYCKITDQATVDGNGVDCRNGLSKDQEFYDFFFHGGVCFIRRRYLDRVGYFDPSLFRQAEEIDLGFRLAKVGGRVIYYPGVSIFHKANSKNRNPKHIKRFRFRNQMIINWRYLPLPDALVYTVWQLGAEAVRALREGWLPHYLRALMELMVKLPKTIICERDPVSRQIMRRIYYLQTHIAQDYQEVEDSAIHFWEYYVHQLKSRFVQRQRLT